MKHFDFLNQCQPRGLASDAPETDPRSTIKNCE